MEGMPSHGDGLDFRNEHGASVYSRIRPLEELGLDDFESFSLPSGVSLRRKKLWRWAKILFWVALAFGVAGAIGMWVFPTFLDKV